MEAGNPVLSAKAFERAQALGGERTMTVQGAINKTALLLVILLAAAGWTWHVYQTNPAALGGYMMAGLLGGLVLALITIFAKRASAITAPLYAAAEGLVLGAISILINAQYHGIVSQAVGLTAGVLGLMLFAYKTRIIQATPRFVVGVMAATGAIALVYLVSIVLSFFGVQVPYLHSSGPVGIGISVVIVIVAALNLIIDFGFIEQAAAAGAPKYMEWYAAFGLMVTLVWLYLEILRLLAKLRSRD